MEQTNFGKFKSSLIDNSISTDYHKAVEEWDFMYAYEEEECCICGKNILKCCLIQNKYNYKKLVVGSTCVKKFLGIETEGMFKELKNRNKYVYSYVEELHGKNKINDWEATFLISLIKFKTLSVKQREHFGKIDKKVKKSYYR